VVLLVPVTHTSHTRGVKVKPSMLAVTLPKEDGYWRGLSGAAVADHDDFGEPAGGLARCPGC
jgi:hypothetical protein